ncbi:hypothetical protein SAMIE_1025830 [Sphingobium amiense]|uniref:Uncharacterized protein n=1 Tax=Sphingobium amiense TaxID=135719 RepID=A0A494WE89_9SPHN|nr:hypothetical protein [Sphingobium amiense]BBD99082.1 hypothetical protein SAMIE_1025830 [Sphingobium amiense]
MRRVRLILPLIALLAPLPVAAQPAPPPQRVLNLTVYGEDPCPKSEGEDIVVCARRPESERYRIPKKLREKPEVAGGPGWGSQVATMEQVQRNTTPMGCSPIGGANTGCYAQMMAQWFAERRRMQSEANP